jgi:hypothetical protein
MSRGVGSLAPITILEANDVVKVVGRNLEQSTVGGGYHAMESPRGNMKDRPRVQNLGLEALDIFAGNQLELAFKDSKGLLLDLVILEAQGLPRSDEQNLADIVGSLGKDLFMSPWFLDHPRINDVHIVL